MSDRKKLLRITLWLFLAGVFVFAFFNVFPALTDPSCIAQLAHSAGEEAIRIPTNCQRTPDVAPDSMTRYFEQNRRGLIHKAWITCQDASQQIGLNFVHDLENDPRWLPSYVPRTYQFRRTVVIFPYANPVPQGSPVLAEIALMPWRQYLSEIAGECKGKFGIWKSI